MREAGEAANFAQAACAMRGILGVAVSNQLSPLADARGYARRLILAPPRQGGDYKRHGNSETALFRRGRRAVKTVKTVKIVKAVKL